MDLNNSSKIQHNEDDIYYLYGEKGSVPGIEFADEVKANPLLIFSIFRVVLRRSKDGKFLSIPVVKTQTEPCLSHNHLEGLKPINLEILLNDCTLHDAASKFNKFKSDRYKVNKVCIYTDTISILFEAKDSIFMTPILLNDFIAFA